MIFITLTKFICFLILGCRKVDDCPTTHPICYSGMCVGKCLKYVLNNIGALTSDTFILKQNYSTVNC